MTAFHLVVVPVGKIGGDDLEALLPRAARALRRPLELRGNLKVPPGVEDRERGQFRATELMSALRSTVPQLSAGKLIGGDDPQARPPARADAYIFVTDVDLFTANSDSVFAAWNRTANLGIVSVRRLREAFYRRKADAAKQRSRLVKEVVRVAARLQDAPQCADPQCVLSGSKVLPDVDAKDENFCRACARRLFEGRIRV